MSFWILIRENFRIAINAIRSNLLRSIITIFIIAIGITALVGILTAIDVMKDTLNSQFSSMGANTFSIQNRGMRTHGEGSRGAKYYKNIDFREAVRFKEKFEFPAVVSVYIQASGTSTVKYKSIKTNPNIPVYGIDENYIQTGGYDIKKGRNFTADEIKLNRNYVIIGASLATKLFKSTVNPIDKIIRIGNGKYKVIGVLEEKGESMTGAGDKECLLPLTNVRQYYSWPNMNYQISVQPNNKDLLDIAVGEAEGVFRQIRKLKIKDDNNFEVLKSDSLVNVLIENLSKVTFAAVIIAFITLLNSIIGLTNIMLVAVSERTREIGTRKAIGANSKMIRQQFMFEAIVIGQLGGLLGIILGISIGNLISIFANGTFIIPWLWILSGVLLCMVASLLSGIIPAIKASKLDPIIALRYE